MSKGKVRLLVLAFVITACGAIYAAASVEWSGIIGGSAVALVGVGMVIYVGETT